MGVLVERGLTQRLRVRAQALEARGQRRGAGPEVGIERLVEFAAGLGQDQLAQQVAAPLGNAKADVTAARMALSVLP